jgi:pimeloyl-ACP methyl ester carboxylesterase
MILALRRPRSIRRYSIWLPILLVACTSTTEIPQWFDAISRMPVRTVLVDGHRIAYLDIGQGSPVILIHGFGGSLWQWEYQQDTLSRSHRLITLDLIGSGFSDKPDIGYTPDELLSFFRRFMDALHISRASLAGNSMGAGLVIGMALAHPDRVDRLVLISGLPNRVQDKLTSPLIRRGLDRWAPDWLIQVGSYVTGRDVTRRVLSEIIHDKGLITPAVLERSHRNRKRPGMLKPVLKTADNLPLWEAGFARRLGEIRHPVLIVWGTQDHVFPPHVGEDMHGQIPGSRLELVPDAGHIPMWERPDVVNPLLLDFLTP